MRDRSGNYRLIQQIGRGGMGQVWSGVRLGREGMVMPCAIKVLHPALALTTDDCQRFFNEARIAAQLDHGRIVKVTDTGEVQGSPFLVMEWVDGVNLRELLRRVDERLDWEISLYIVGEILAALEYAHERTIGGSDAGVIHYDVTPGNILISSSGEVKLTDFGIARFAASVDGTMSHSVGTPRYMSPEQMSGRARRETDIYSLGVVLHELLEGVRYLEGQDHQQFQNLVLGGYVPELRRTDLPPWVDRLRRQMLATRPEERPRAADARSVILEKTAHYHLASRRLEELYGQFVGERRSGLTELLELEDVGLEYKQMPGSARTPGSLEIAKLEAGSGAEEPTVAEGGDEDSPMVFRRPRDRVSPQSSPPTTTERTLTDGPPLLEMAEPQEPTIEPTIRLPAAFEEQPPQNTTPRAAATEDGEPAPQTLQLPRGRPVVQPPVFLGADPSPAGGVALGPVPELRQRGAAVWVMAGLGGALVVLLAVLIGMLAADRADKTEPQEARAARDQAEPGTAEQAELESSSAAPADPKALEEPTRKPEPIVVGDTEPAVEPDEEPAVAESEEKPKAEPEPAPAVTPTKPEPKPDPKPRSKPKPKPPRVEVVFVIAGHEKAEIQVGQRSVDYNYAAMTKLRPGNYEIRWRGDASDSWHSPGALSVEELPPGNYYDVRLGVTDMLVKVKEEGSAK